ncbi:pyridoxal-dependent decarboxylase [Dactylosporangium fulvum]|uniref:Pyridoxal-dependent decarboxylase n=1 Tax=Dactylosporangium fulvum TaxID=53359 RepID=A0ABY5VRN7_9ACTN|nr:pyridoxal-dependent decarboxylase [Dactylosporangium fulvum]UWP79471.1 pyridoxal-dependent decarboxylase [Dactylosporangium fulvum]
MADPLHERDETLPALREVVRAAGPYLDALPERLVYDRAAEPLLDRLGGPLPEDGRGTRAAVEELLRVGTATATASAGPRFFHFVIGGATPAALAADWVVSLLDQNAFVRASSRFADTAERVALDWLRQLFGLPAGWGGALTASATFANVTGLALATHWWAERHGVDVASAGLAGLPRMPVLSGGHVHPSARKALQLLGHGKDTVEVFARDGTGRVDLDGLRRRLGAVGPAVVIGTAGEPNAGDFDPVADLADLAGEHCAWLHVDGAFGLFAALSPRTAHLTAGVERADSVAADAHKWLNVPYESGFVLVRDPSRLGPAFGMPGAPYLPGPDDPRGGYGLLGPESSRRARALPIWATLAAYGRGGYRELVERHCDLARHLAAAVDAAPDLERLAEVPLNVVCFRYRPPGLAEPELDALNRRLGEALLDDGRVYAGATVYDGRAALRPAISNWRTTEGDLDLLVAVVRELGDRLRTTA